MKRVLLVAAYAAITVASGCASIGKSLGDGLMSAVNDQAPSIGRGIVKGAGEGVREDVLTDPTTQKLNATVTTVVGNAVTTAVNKAGDAVVQRLPEVREQAIGQLTREQVRQLVEVVLETAEARARQGTRGLMADVGNGLRDQVLSEATDAKLNALLAQLGDTAGLQAVKVRNQVLNDQADQQVKVLVDGAMGAVVDGTERIRRQAHEELSFVQRNTAESLIAIGIAAGVVVWLVWREKEKNRLLLSLIARHLQEVADPKQRDEIVANLQKQAADFGLENQLKNVIVGWFKKAA